jgi:hypothetical protein
MTEKDLYQHLNQAFDAFAAKPSGEVFLDMQRSGLIDAEGEPQHWDAFLAIVATNATDDRKATYFRCRKPALGLPGRTEIDISRDSMIAYLKEGKRIITATVDETSKAIRVGEDVHLTSHETIRTDANDVPEDNLGCLPRMLIVNSTL